MRGNYTSLLPDRPPARPPSCLPSCLSSLNECVWLALSCLESSHTHPLSPHIQPASQSLSVPSIRPSHYYYIHVAP